MTRFAGLLLMQEGLLLVQGRLEQGFKEAMVFLVLQALTGTYSASGQQIQGRVVLTAGAGGSDS